MRTEMEDVQGRTWTVEAAEPAREGAPYFLTFRREGIVHRRSYEGGKAPGELTDQELRDLLHASP